MAGIGFTLRKLARQDNLLGVVQAYFHAALISTGPWILTVLAIASTVFFSSQSTHAAALRDFRLIIIYNFAFALVISSPITIIVTRYLADKIYANDVTSIPGTLLGSLALLTAVELPIVCWFYFIYVDMTAALALSAVINFFSISAIWVVGVFLSTLKNYIAISQAFAVGLLIGVVTGVAAAGKFGSMGILTGFNLGVCITLFLLMGRVFVEYPFRVKEGFHFLAYFKKYWELALGALLFNVGSWADKWIMWFSPEREVLPNKLFCYSNYDSAMFLAYLTVVPIMAAFVFSIETAFFEDYIKFYRDIQRLAPLKRIRENHQAMMLSLGKILRNFFILQGVVTILVILCAPKIFSVLNINYLQIGIFRYGVLGSFFNVMGMFMIILLSYFDSRKKTLLLQGTFCAANIIATLVVMPFGFTYYGYGYFLSSLVLFLTSAILVERHVRELPFHTFITSNSSIS